MIPPCPVCGMSPLPEPIVLQHTLYRCSHCGLLYSERVGDPDAIARYYQEGQEQYFELPYFDRHPLEQHPEHANYLRALQRLWHSDGSDQRLLDVGCGTGALLQEARRLGFDAEGLEVSDTHVEDFTVHRYDGNMMHLPAMGLFDIIVLWDVLEHVADPSDTLEILGKFLRPNGRILIRTINEDCLLSSWSMMCARFGFLAPARRMHEIYHVVYFTAMTLDLCIERSGFTMRERWFGEFPVERASRSPFVRFALRCVYFLQRAFGRPFEQYVIITKIRSPRIDEAIHRGTGVTSNDRSNRQNR